MPHYPLGYLSATRHPWPCLWFLVPLLALYEAGVLWLGGAHPDALRNGADTWLRWGLESFGLRQYYVAPALVVGLLLIWSWVRIMDRPDRLVRLWLGMALESAAFALGLWILSRHLGVVLEDFGIRLSTGPDNKALCRMITFVGAGIYEEVLFRLLLLFVLNFGLRLLGLPSLLTLVLAAVFSSIIFAAAHHVGPYGEPFDRYVFVFRMVASLYFAILFQLRGFGIAVGAHASYDVLVGVLVA